MTKTRAALAARLSMGLLLLAASVAAQPAPASPVAPRIVAVRAGRLIDPATGSIATDQIILVKGNRFEAVGRGLAIPPGAEVIDLSGLTVLPGLVDTHNHLAITYKEFPERNNYYITVVTERLVLAVALIFRVQGDILVQLVLDADA
ncbi:MAG: hypothetical protein ACXWK4_10835, partial [Myxococcaceae bacterium]